MYHAPDATSVEIRAKEKLRKYMDVVDLRGGPSSLVGVDDADRTPLAQLEGSMGELLFKRGLRTEASRAVRNK